MTTEGETRRLICSRCGRVMRDYAEVGYDGPHDRGDESCHPLMAWELLCQQCENDSGEGA